MSAGHAAPRPRRRLALALAALLLAAPSAARAQAGLTTPEIILQSARFDCLEWTIIGLCFWLECDAGGCRVQTTVLVRHFNPSLVVTTANSLGTSPWVEAQALYGALQLTVHEAEWGPAATIQGGDSNNAPVDSLTHTRPAEAIGHPGSVISILGPMSTVICPMVDVAPYYPYFLAGLDSAAWYGGYTELLYPQSYIPGLNEIGPWPIQTWGNVYPRIGQITHPENPKAAAVIVQRAADIVTRPFQPHVYTMVGLVPGWPEGNMLVWPPMMPVTENDPTSHRWQMLRPLPDTCEIFGAPDVATGSFAGWASGKNSITGDYAWNLWRPYECCRKHRDVFIGRVP